MTDKSNAATAGAVRHLNPAGLAKNPAFTQAVAVTGPATTIYIGMQTAVDGSGAIVGRGDIAAQTEQTLKNVQACLEAAGAGPEHIVQWTICIAQGQPLQPAFAAGQRWWGQRANPPANTVLVVVGFPHPDFLVGIEAVAVVPHAP
jgi:enamine deaminase RidA (YjgF/YER057c/UK114 family)